MRRQILCRVRVLFAAGIYALSSSAMMQAQAKPSALPVEKSVPGAKTLAFDVVSIRQSGKDDEAYFKIMRDGYEVTGMPILSVILTAYFPAPYINHSAELKGEPGWVDSERYDITAKVSPSDLSQWESQGHNMYQTSPMLQTMLRAMLAERFKLQIHSVPTQMNGYALSLSKHKLKLEKETEADVSTVAGVKLLDGGKAVGSTKDDKPVWEFYGTSMKALAGFLSFNVSGPLTDNTGLQDKYHFILSAPDQGPETPGQTGPAASDPDALLPFDIEALGLKLDKVKVSAKSWVIDSIQRPSPN